MQGVSQLFPGRLQPRELIVIQNAIKYMATHAYFTRAGCRFDSQKTLQIPAGMTGRVGGNGFWRAYSYHLPAAGAKEAQMHAYESMSGIDAGANVFTGTGISTNGMMWHGCSD